MILIILTDRYEKHWRSRIWHAIGCTDTHLVGVWNHQLSEKEKIHNATLWRARWFSPVVHEPLNFKRLRWCNGWRSCIWHDSTRTVWYLDHVLSWWHHPGPLNYLFSWKIYFKYFNDIQYVYCGLISYKHFLLQATYFSKIHSSLLYFDNN